VLDAGVAQYGRVRLPEGVRRSSGGRSRRRRCRLTTRTRVAPPAAAAPSVSVVRFMPVASLVSRALEADY
jgi:hypothetical protein